MKQDKPKIKLTITPNSHRLKIAFGDKAELFCSAKLRIKGNIINIAGIKITSIVRADIKDGEFIFYISTDDAARLLTRLSRPAYSASMNYAEPRITTKWDTRVTFAAKDFECGQEDFAKMT